MPTQQSPPSGSRPAQPLASGQALDAVREAAERLRYGMVQLTIHDGRIVQLDITERCRFT